MRVRISYGVELEEVPETAENLGTSAEISLKEAIRILERSLESIEDCENDFSTPLDLLEKVRLKLTNADLIITDVQAILEGLQNYYEGENNVSSRRSTMDSGGSTNVPPEE